MTLSSTLQKALSTRDLARWSLLSLTILTSQLQALSMPQRVTVIDRRGIYVVEQPSSQPYLVAVGAAPLRFSEPAPEPTEVPLPRVVHPAPVEMAEQPAPPTPTVAALPPPTPSTPVEEKVAVAPVENHGSKPLPVLLDDTTRHPVRAEDVLPYFQFPGANSSSPGMILPPEPTQVRSASSLPSSSATYQQK
jgi:hypothetical protein